MMVQMALLKYMAKGPELRIVTRLYLKKPCAKGSTKLRSEVHSILVDFESTSKECFPALCAQITILTG